MNDRESMNGRHRYPDAPVAQQLTVQFQSMTIKSVCL